MNTNEFEISRPVLVGDTADIHLHRALSILRSEGVNPDVVMEFTAGRDAVLCGVAEAKALLNRVLPEHGREVFALPEGTHVSKGEVVLRVRAPYASFGLYETAICGTLASCSGWATAARECVDAAGTIPVACVGARYVHPSVAGLLDYSAVSGGKCATGSSVLGGRLAGHTPTGTMPHALVLLLGDTVRALAAFDKHMPPEVPRVALVDTMRDEVEESLEVAKSLRDKLRGVRLETPEERGGVTPDLVKELRARLDQAGYNHVEIHVGGDMTPELIKLFVASKAPVAGFAVSRYVAGAQPVPFSADVKEISGKNVARRGRIPGLAQNPRLARVA